MSVFRCEWSDLDTWGCEKPEPWAHFLWVMVTLAELTQKLRLNHTKYCLTQLVPKKNFTTQTSTTAKKKSAELSCPCCHLWFIFWHFHPLHQSLPALMSPYLAWHTGLPPAGQSEKPSWSLCPQSLKNVGRCITVRFYSGTAFTLDFPWLQ